MGTAREERESLGQLLRPLFQSLMNWAPQSLHMPVFASQQKRKENQTYDDHQRMAPPRPPVNCFPL